MKTYLTVLTTDQYLIGVLALHQSLMKTNPEYGLVVLMTENVSELCEKVLNRKGVKTKRAARLPSMVEKAKESHNKRRNNLSKILMFELIEYKKIVYLDSDMMIMRNIDHLFKKPHMSAVAAGSLFPGNEHWKQLNSGLMVIKPETGLANRIMSHLPKVEKNNESFGDQKLLYAEYSNWPGCPELHLDHKYNLLIGTLQYYFKKHRYNLNFKSPDNKTAAVIHFVGSNKPWMKSSEEQLAYIKKYEDRGDFLDAKMLHRYYDLINKFRK